MINGIINVRKEPGYTSHDVVARLRGILKQKKIGHTGTLDPDAEGVLPVCLGKATKLCDMIGGWDKSYEAVMLLGKTTDTEDISGTVLGSSPVKINEEKIAAILNDFVGDYLQVPPMYSAKKVKGKKLYELAREGITIERNPCPVHISNIDIKEIRLPCVSFSVTCSKGTYIRSLCRDVGEKAGCGACMASLVRTRVADFCLEDSVSLEDIEKARDEGRLKSLITSIDSVFMNYPALKVPVSSSKLLMNGNPLPYRIFAASNNSCIVPDDLSAADRHPVRIYDHEEHFIGLYTNHVTESKLKPYKLFFDN